MMANIRRLLVTVCGGNLERSRSLSSSKRWNRFTRLKLLFSVLLLFFVLLLLTVAFNFTLTTPSPAQRLQRLRSTLAATSHVRKVMGGHHGGSFREADTPSDEFVADGGPMKVKAEELEPRANVSQRGRRTESGNDEIGKTHPGSPPKTRIAERSTQDDPHEDPHKDTRKDSVQDHGPLPSNVKFPRKGAKGKIIPATKVQNGANNASTDITYWTDVPGSLPAWVRFGLHWAEGPIGRGRPHWQVLGRGLEAFLYSAHFDDMTSPPVVRAVGILYKMVSFLNVTCHYHDSRDGPSVHRVSGSLYHFRGLNGRKYVGAYADCPLPERSDYLPYAVSISRNVQDERTNFMIVHYSQSDAWLKKRSSTFYAKIRQRNQVTAEGYTHNMGPDGNEHKRKWEEEAGTGSGRKWNITRCFPAIHGKWNDYLTVAEMAAASLAMGVQRFVFYVESAGPDLLRMLKVLEKKGLAEIHPWNLHLSGNLVFYAAQASAIQECFYRHLSSSKFLLFGDVDELFVPRQNLTLLPLLNEVFNNKSQCGAAVFRNAFFNVNRSARALPSVQDPTGYATQQRLTMLTHTRRIARIWPSPRRTKPAVDPRRVVTPGIHSVETFRKGYRLCPLDPEQGLLQHYRVITPKQAGPMSEVEDTHLWRYTRDIIRHFEELIREFHHEDAKGQGMT